MRVALDLEDEVVDLSGLFMEEMNRFIQEHHPECDLEVERERPADWRFESVRDTMAEIRDWEETEDFEEKFFNGDSGAWDGHEFITRRIWKENPESYQPTAGDLEEKVEEIRSIVDEKGGSLSLVTARMGVEQAVKKRLHQLGLLKFFDSVIFETEKHRLDFDIYVDDYPYLHSNLEEGLQVMVTRPWNIDENLGNRHLRVESVRQLPEVLEDLG